MKLLLHRQFGSENDTLGRLYYRDHNQNVKYVYTLEDEYREKKVPGETRIAEGFYDLGVKRAGKFYDMYAKSSVKEIVDFTKKYGVMEILNVSNFEAILIHTGNQDTDTQGCLLVGDMTNNNSLVRGYITDSMKAYARLLQAIEFYLDKGETIRLEIVDFDREVSRLV